MVDAVTDDGTVGRTERRRGDGRDGTPGQRTHDDDGTNDWTDGWTVEDVDEVTEDGTDGRTEDDDGDWTDATGRTYDVSSQSFKYEIGTKIRMSKYVQNGRTFWVKHSKTSSNRYVSKSKSFFLAMYQPRKSNLNKVYVWIRSLCVCLLFEKTTFWNMYM